MAKSDEEIERVRTQLRIAVNKVPLYVQHGFIHEVRNWKDARARAMKLLGKRNATLQELMGALASIQ